MQFMLFAKINLLLQNISGEREAPKENREKAAIKSHRCSAWILHCKSKQSAFRLNDFVSMKEPNLRYFRECCVCMPLVTGFSNCEGKMSVALCSDSSLTFSDLV